MKYIITESQYNKAIDKFISSQFEGFEVRILPEYYNTISKVGLQFWVKNGEVIAEIDNHRISNNQANFFIKTEIWDIISKMFSLEYDDVESVIKQWLEYHYNLGELTPLQERRSETIIWNKITI